MLRKVRKAWKVFKYEMNIHLPNDQWTIHQLERLWMSLYGCFHVGNMWSIVKPLVSYYTQPSNRQLPVTHHHDCSLPERDHIHKCSDRWQFACTTWCCYYTWIKRYVQFWTLTYSCYLGLESWSFPLGSGDLFAIISMIQCRPLNFFLSTPREDCISSVFLASFLRNPNANHFSEIWVSPVTCHRPRFHQVSDPNTEQLFIFGSCTEFLVGAEQGVVQKHNGRCVIFCCHYLLTLVQTFTVVFWNFLLNLISCGAIAFNAIYRRI